MNDEADTPQPGDEGSGNEGRSASRVLRGLVHVFGGPVMVAIIAIAVFDTYVCASDEPEGPHCAEENGNMTCVERYGGNQPYCDRSTTIFHGCISVPPPREFAAHCGSLVEGLPGDPTCLKVVADNPPNFEQSPLEKFLELLLTVAPIVIGVGICLYPFLIKPAIESLKPLDRRLDRSRRNHWRPEPKLPSPKVDSDPPPTTDDQPS